MLFCIMVMYIVKGQARAEVFRDGLGWNGGIDKVVTELALLPQSQRLTMLSLYWYRTTRCQLLNVPG